MAMNMNPNRLMTILAFDATALHIELDLDLDMEMVSVKLYPLKLKSLAKLNKDPVSSLDD